MAILLLIRLEVQVAQALVILLYGFSVRYDAVDVLHDGLVKGISLAQVAFGDLINDQVLSSLLLLLLLELPLGLA